MVLVVGVKAAELITGTAEYPIKSAVVVVLYPALLWGMVWFRKKILNHKCPECGEPTVDCFIQGRCQFVGSG